MGINQFVDFWKKHRGKPWTGDAFLGVLVAFVLRFIPVWIGATAPSSVWVVAVGGAIGWASYYFDWVSDDG